MDKIKKPVNIVLLTGGIGSLIVIGSNLAIRDRAFYIDTVIVLFVAIAIMSQVLIRRLHNFNYLLRTMYGSLALGFACILFLIFEIAYYPFYRENNLGFHFVSLAEFLILGTAANLFIALFTGRKSMQQLPDGWPESKISDYESIVYIPDEQKREWLTERRSKDSVELLINKDGFHLKSHGRSGMVYYVEGGKLCEIYFEISGVPQFDLLFEFDSLDSWFYPESLPINEIAKNEIKRRFVTWLAKEKIRAQL